MHIANDRLRRIAAFLAFGLLAACGAEDMTKAPPPIGDFRLGYTVIVADNAKKAGPSRTATAEEWETILAAELAKRIGRYEGEKLYHLGINIDAYALAIPGIPVVLKPRSVLVVSANVWDDTAGVKINAEPKQITIFEGFSAETFIGSGLTQTREQQMANLSANMAREIHSWLVENKAWFSAEAVAARAAAPKAPASARRAPTPATAAPAPAAAAPVPPPVPTQPRKRAPEIATYP